MTVSSSTERDLRPVSEREAEVYVASTCFKTGPPGNVGVEVERTVHARDDCRRPVDAERVRAAVLAAPSAAELPAGGRVTLEPGGQLELSTGRPTSLPATIASVRADLELLDHRLARSGLRPGTSGLDPYRSPRRSLTSPRYCAMERCFDRDGSAGRTMMCSTASVQVCLDAGTTAPGTAAAVTRWRRLHLLAPVLVAMFANSPFRQGRPNGWRSGRQAAWLGMRGDRVAPPSVDEDPAVSWAGYALDASVVCVPGPGPSWEVPAGLTMREWLRGEGPRPATLADLDYHLTTLFPPVRPRGFLELRVVDAQAGTDWEVVVAVVTALVEDPAAAAFVDAAGHGFVDPTGDPMVVAARQGLRDDRLASAAARCMAQAIDALPRVGADAATRRRVEGFAERHTFRRRTPADERLDDYNATGRLEAPVEEARDR